MGHHHRKNKNHNQDKASIPQNTAQSPNPNPLANMDLSSMLSSLNIDNVDLSKIDFAKVQSMMDKIKLPESSTGGTTETNGNINTNRITLLNSLKPFLPPTRSKSIDNITKLFQIASLMGNSNTQSR